MQRNFVPPSRTGSGWRDHVHKLVREIYEDSSGKYRYRCLECGQRLKAKSGVMVKTEDSK